MSLAHGLQPGQPLANVSKLEAATAVIVEDEDVGLAASEDSIELAQHHPSFAHITQLSQGPFNDSESKITSPAIIQGREEETEPSAATRCLAVAELFERVLQNTSSMDISRYRYVCRAWKALIENSPPLQRRLIRALAGQQAAAAARLRSARLHFSRRYRQCAFRRQTEVQTRIPQYAYRANSGPGPVLSRSLTAATRVFAIAELCEKVLQHSTSKCEIFERRLVCRAWKASIEGSPLLKRKLLTMSAKSRQRPEEYSGNPSGINDLIFKGRAANMPQPRDPHHMLLYYKDPDDATGPQNNPALEQLDIARNGVMVQMFLTQPPVSRIYTT